MYEDPCPKEKLGMMNGLALLQSRHPKGIVPSAANLGLPPEKEAATDSKMQCMGAYPNKNESRRAFNHLETHRYLSPEAESLRRRPEQIPMLWIVGSLVLTGYIIISDYVHLINQYMWRSMSLTSSVS